MRVCGRAGAVGQGLFALSRMLNPMGTNEHPLERDISSGYGSGTQAVMLCWFHFGMVMDGFILRVAYFPLCGQKWLNSFLINWSKSELEILRKRFRPRCLQLMNFPEMKGTGVVGRGRHLI